MTESRINGGKTGADTRFQPGNSGRRKGSRHKVTLAVEALLEGEHEKLTRVAIDRALGGDMVALRLCLERIAPPRRDAPVRIELPAIKSAADAVDASAAVLEAVASGDITPEEAGRIMVLLTAHKALVETCELEQRIEALEGKQK